MGKEAAKVPHGKEFSDSPKKAIEMPAGDDTAHGKFNVV